MSGQYFLAAVTAPEAGFSAPIAVITWAHVNGDVDRRLAASGDERKRLQPNEWTGGEHCWLIDAVGDANVVLAALADLAAGPLAGTLVKVAARLADEGKQEVLSLETLLANGKKVLATGKESSR